MRSEESASVEDRGTPSPPVDSPHTGQPVDQEKRPRLDFAVVGIGASAGGLESYAEFLKATPPDTGMAFVLVQHLSPQYESMLADILSRHTAMKVHQVEDGMAVEPNHVYVIRPGHTMTIRDGRLHLGESLLSPGHRRPVDDFFRSLADEQRERAIAVILSGMGSNGTGGAQSVKAVGGLCIAEHPETAKYPSMPQNLIDAGFADAVLHAAEIPQAIIRYVSHPYVTGQFDQREYPARDPNALNDILALLRIRTRHDFGGYKKPTILRRVERRMGLTQIRSLDEYARFIRQTPAEVTSLADDLMIHVTGFFRDPEVWESLRKSVITRLIAERDEREPIRAWVTACSTGEESYTLAMLLVEAAEAAGKEFDIKVFSTDTAERSLARARAGIFPGGIESEITAERLDRFFDKEDTVYRVKKELRELVIFAPQNLLQDPPFSRLDICTCRNLLIYLEPEMQQRAIALLHFGLREGGAMMLGNSETIGADMTSMFEPIDKKLRIYRRIGPTRHGSLEFPMPMGAMKDSGSDVPSDTRSPSRAAIPQIANRLLLTKFTPPAVAVDRDGTIVYFHGNTELFLDQPRGEPTRSIFDLARENVRGAVRVALQRATSHNAAASVRDGVIETVSGPRRVEVIVTPLDRTEAPAHFLVTFFERPEAAELPPGVGASEQNVRVELQRVRDELQSTIEELQSANEEMKASGEETTSINEELQSTNEELETSKEELQSLNEELTTVNTQLQAKMDEVERTGNDLASLLSSTDIAVIFLDTQFRIRRYTPATKDLVELIPTDIGRPLNDLARKFIDPDLIPDAHTVLERLAPIEKEITSKSERWYMRRVLPYRTNENKIDGVVITFVDITERRKSQKLQRDLEDRLMWSVQASGIGHWEIEFPLRSFFCSARARELLALMPDQASDYAGLLAIVHPADRPELERAIDRAINPTSDGPFSVEFRVAHLGASVWLEARGAATFVDTAAGRVPSRLRGIIADITQRKLAETILLEAKRQAEAASEAKDQFLATVSHELRTPIAAILLWAKLLQTDRDSPEQHEEGIRSIIRSADAQCKLIEDLLDTARINAGKFRLEYRVVDLTALLRASLENASGIAAGKNIRIESEIAADLDPVRIDPDRIEQLVMNLLNNAIKFTQTGGLIRLDAVRDGDEVQIRFSDNGRGISPESLPNIFNRFQQAESASGLTRAGLGLGLTIARQIADLHGGTITAASPGPGKGATFTVTLPLPIVKGDRPEADAADSVPAESIAGLQILLVEDDATTRKAMTLLLTQFGAALITAATAAEAFAAFEKQRPHIIISDVGLPDADGYSLIRRIRTYEATHGQPPTPAIALSAYTQETDRRAAALSGFDQHVAKPVDPNYLVKTVAQILAAR